ncbi:arsenic resistance protein [Halococcus hamelinensis]|uniref:Bile acid:sodium symporter n=1 Tax=Halococcus hamelinensis 100A6 TaxID=1132509 RepID=M0LZT4_9EURY|nr:bile acid:sodium symporter [Halococcus hamelinensis]EMA37635.1 Bile acid:sodium symporter [Halococcus hamelinensis 100A6]
MEGLTKDWIQRHQILVYAVGVLLAVFASSAQAGSSSVLERLINPVLAVLLYVTFLEVPFVELRRAFANGRFMLTALGMNFLIVPVIVFVLTRFLPQNPVILVGVFMVLLTPCVDYVISFTELANGNSEQVTAVAPVLLLAQLLLLPAYLWMFMGERVAEFIQAGPFIEAFVLIIALPLTLAWLTEAGAERTGIARRWRDTMEWLPAPMMGATLFVVIGSQLPRVENSIGQITAVVPVYIAFLVVMSLLGWVTARIVEMDVGESRALVFTSVTRNSLVILPLALALPAGYELTPAVVVTQTLVELVGMVVLTRVVPAWLVPESEPVAGDGGTTS